MHSTGCLSTSPGSPSPERPNRNVSRHTQPGTSSRSTRAKRDQAYEPSIIGRAGLSIIDPSAKQRKEKKRNFRALSRAPKTSVEGGEFHTAEKSSRRRLTQVLRAGLADDTSEESRRQRRRARALTHTHARKNEPMRGRPTQAGGVQTSSLSLSPSERSWGREGERGGATAHALRERNLFTCTHRQTEPRVERQKERASARK